MEAEVPRRLEAAYEAGHAAGRAEGTAEGYELGRKDGAPDAGGVPREVFAKLHARVVELREAQQALWPSPPASAIGCRGSRTALRSR